MLFTTAKSQKKYEEAIAEGYKALKKDSFDLAIKKYFAAEAFQPNKKDIVNDSIKKVYERILALKKEADKNYRDAKISEKKARANSLSFEALIAEENGS